MGTQRGWPDWIKGIALYGVTEEGDLVLLKADKEGNLSVKILPHAVTHQAGGSDEINVEGLKGVLADLQKAKWSVYDTRANFPAEAEEGALAYATDEKTLYRWDGTSWVKVLSLDLMQLMNRLHATTHESGGDDPIDFLKLTNRKHASKHESGGDDEINVTGLHGELADPQTPKAHASTHQPGGSDALPTGTPSAITEGATGSEGSSTAFARADHVHETPSEWTPKEHGNEAHHPDFLAVDGSNTMKGNLVFDKMGRVTEYFLLWGGGNETPKVMLPYFMNDLAYNTLRGGSVTFNPSPNSGTEETLFDGSMSTVIWANPSGTITVEVTFWKAFGYGMIVGFCQMTGGRAQDFTIELYNSDTGNWETVAQETGYDKGVYATRCYIHGNVVTKMRLTFSNFASSDYFQLAEVFLIYGAHPALNKSYVLACSGGDMYGDLNMNGNDILSPGLVDGVDVSAHAARHHSGGADPIYWNQLAINGDPNLNGHKILNPEGASGGMVAGVKWVNEVVYDGNPPSSWTELDLSSYVGSRRALCFFRIERPNATSSQLYQIVPADYYNVVQDGSLALGPTSCVVKDHGYGYILTMTDDNGRVRIRSNSGESTDKTRLLCYFTVT